MFSCLGVNTEKVFNICYNAWTRPSCSKQNTLKVFNICYNAWTRPSCSKQNTLKVFNICYNAWTRPLCSKQNTGYMLCHFRTEVCTVTQWLLNLLSNQDLGPGGHTWPLIREPKQRILPQKNVPFSKSNSRTTYHWLGLLVFIFIRMTHWGQLWTYI